MIGMEVDKDILSVLADHQTPDFLVSADTGARLDAGQVIDHSKKLLQELTQMGVKPGEPVAFAFSNSIDGAASVLGLMAQGFVAVAINLQAGDKAIQYALGHSEARAVVVDPGSSTRVSSLCDLPQLALANLMTAEAAEIDPYPCLPGDIALIMYTSGTTGTPKGVQLSHRALLAGGRNTAIAHQLGAKDIALCVLPLYHINGLCVTLMAPLISGGCVVIPPKFSVGAFWQTIDRFAVTWFSVVPTQISYLLHNKATVQSPPSLRFGRSASAPLSPAVQKAFEERFGVKIVETMGMTETAAQLLSNPLPPGVCKIGSPGIAYGNQVMIADEHQHERPRGEEGEVLIRGENLMSGYLKNGDATRETLTQEGWLRSGDLGRMDQDGYVFITGRIKELIIKGGENIAPREIDEILYSHPKVIEAAAFAVPCEQYGERPEAAVVFDSKDLDFPDRLLEMCIDQLGHFKAPSKIHVLGELPKGPSGKIQRAKLTEICANV